MLFARRCIGIYPTQSDTSCAAVPVKDASRRYAVSASSTTAKQTQLPARQKKHPSPGSAETFREYLRQRWDAGYRKRTALPRRIAGVRLSGYVQGRRQDRVPLAVWQRRLRTRSETTLQSSRRHRLCSPTPRKATSPPHIAATLLAIPRPDLTADNAQVVDALKVECPGYAVMR